MNSLDTRPGAGVQPTEAGGWAARSHAAVQTVLRAPGWSSDVRRAAAVPGRGGVELPEVAGEILSKVLLFMDAPDHTRVRGLVSKAFTPRTVERLRPRVAELTAELLDPLGRQGRFDVIDDLAFPLPVIVICELLGIPAGDRDLFRRHTRDLAVILDREVTAAQMGAAAGAALHFAAYLLPLFEERRRTPGDDLVSALVAAEEAGDRLGADELLTTVVLLLTAGHETTMNLIGNGFLALLRAPDQLARLRADPGLMPNAVEELLRHDSPVRQTGRVALADTALDGVEVRAGDTVIAHLHEANHDPAVFESPGTLDITRDARRHLSFGAGAHYCLGAALARAEAQIALRALIELPDVTLAIDEPRWRPSVTLHGLESLPVECSTATNVS